MLRCNGNDDDDDDGARSAIGTGRRALVIGIWMMYLILKVPMV